MSDYLTAEQYEYARKTGDWESGKVLTHGQALNNNQKIVLEYLKSKITESSVNPINAIVILGHLWEFRRFNTEEECLVLEAYWQLNSKQQVEVLQAFSAWVLEEEEEE
ncbi:hypothetical protein [Enterococcus faecium]|uniref:hypothetical protein n=1 Tax=Enterococcus faecium TaxID=1352 RepID=UPI001159FBE9|nr:hypothetical protein [Enterococcus faecium]